MRKKEEPFSKSLKWNRQVLLWFLANTKNVSPNNILSLVGFLSRIDIFFVAAYMALVESYYSKNR